MRSSNRGRSLMFLCVAVVALLGVSVAPVQSACSLGCGNIEGSQGEDLFKVGKTYTYNLETEMQVQLTGQDPQDTSVKVQAQVLVTAGANCEHSMQVQKFGMWTKVGDQKVAAQKLSEEIEKDMQRPVRFSMKGQKIGKEICADAKDSAFALNIKRGLVSLLQGHPTERGNDLEYDVFGQCPISNSEVSGDSTRIFLKRKDLTKCEGREHFTATGLVRSVFNSNSDVKSTPIMTGEYVMEQRIKNGQTHPESIQLTEYYEVGSVKNLMKLKAENTGMNQVKSKVVSKLVFLGMTAGKLANIEGGGVQREVRFEGLPNGRVASLNTLKATMKSMIENGFGPNGNVQEFTAKQFLQLVRIMRDTKKDDLLTLYQQVKNGNVHPTTSLAKKLYFDALFRANSADSVEAISSLVGRQMDAAEQKMAYMSLQFAGQLNKESLASIQKLLDANPSYEAYLVAGSLVHKYCEQFACTPQNLKPIMDKFATALKCNGKMDKKAEHQMIAILKGLKNSEQIKMDNVLDKVYNCYQESIKIKRVRVQSVKTMSASLCHSPKGRDLLKSILKEKNVDPEFRIHAYLGLIKNCATHETVEYLQGIYNAEETNQLVTFLYSHIASLKMTTDPSRQVLRALVKDFDLSKHSLVGTDFRKTSFNQERSFNLEAFGVGGSADANVIFTKNGFLPRSMNLNFSAEVFGRDYNFLEVELRQENLESIGEKLFGPRGYFHSKKNQDIVNEIESSVDQLKTDTSNYRRAKRDAINLKEDTTKFNKQLHNTDQDLNTDLDLDLSINMFGSEVKFLALSELECFQEARNGDFVKGMSKAFNKALDDAKNWEKSVEAYHLLMDTEFEYPTGIGIPLKARAQVSMATKFGAKLKFDLREFLFSAGDKKDFKFQIEMTPSVSVSGQTGLFMDLGFQRLGMQLNGNLFTSLNGDLDFKVTENGHKWNMDFRAKEKKQEFVKIDHSIIFVQQDQGAAPVENALKFQATKKEFTACFDQLYPMIGMNFCADYSFTVPNSKTSTGWTALGNLVSAPLNGPNRLGLWVEMDPVYNFQLTFESKEGINAVEFTADCPHKGHNRLVKMRGEVGLMPKTYVKMMLASPLKTASMEMGYKNDNKEVVLYGEALDDKNMYEAKIGFAKTAPNEYTPILLVKYPGKERKSMFGLMVDGKIRVEKKGGLEVYIFENLQIQKTEDGVKSSGEPLVINGKVEYKPITFVIDLRAEHGGKRMGIKGDLQFNLPQLLIDLKTDSMNAEWNTEFHYDLRYAKNELFQQLLKAKLGTKKEYDVYFMQAMHLDKALLESKKSEEFANAIKKFEIKSSFTPSHPVAFDVLYENDKKSGAIAHGVTFKCSRVDFSSKLNMKKSDKLDYDLTYKLAMNKHFVDVLSKLNTDGSTVDLHKRAFTNKVALSNGYAMDLNGNFVLKPKNGDFDLDFTNALMDNAKKPQYKVSFKLKNQLKQLGWDLNVNVLNQPKDLVVGKFALKKSEEFTLDMTVQEILNLNTQFKFNEVKVGKEKLPQVKGEGFVLLKFPRANNYQVKANSKFAMGQPNYDLNVEVLYDFERDNTKKAVFNTNNVVKSNEYHTKNSLEILDKKYQLNGNYQMTGAVDNGNLKFDGQVVMPTGRVFSADFKRKLDKKPLKDTDFSYSGNVDFALKDQTTDKGARTIVVTGKLIELNPRAGKFDVGYKIELADYDRSNLVFEPTVKIARGEQMNLGLNVYGKMMPEKLTATLQVKNELKKTDQVNYDLKANYGKSIDLTSVGHIKLVPGGTNFDYKIHSKVNMDANSLAKSVAAASKMAAFKSAELNLQGKSSGKLNENFEWHFVNEAVLNANDKYHANLDLVGNVESFFKTKVSVLAEKLDKHPFELETSYMINKDVKLKAADDRTEDSPFQRTAVYQFFKNGGEFLGKVNYHGKDEVKMDVLLDKKDTQLHSMTAHLTSTVEQLKDHKVVIAVRKFDATSFSNVNMALNADYYRDGAAWYKTNLVVDTTPTAPVFEAELDNLHLKVKSTIKYSGKVNRDLNTLHSELLLANFPVQDFNFHGKLDWANYQLATTVPLKLTLHVDCAKWQLQNFEMTVKGNRVGQKATIDVNAVNKGKSLVSGQLEVAEGSTSSGDMSILLEGKGNMKLQDGAKHDLKFTLMRKKVGKSDRHMELMLNGEVDKKNFLFELKLLEGATIAKHSICMNGDKRCTNIELKSERKSVTFDNFEHEFVLNFDVRPLGDVFESYYNNLGLTFITKKVGFEFSNDFNLFIENKQKSYKVSANSKNPQTTVEVAYPGRKMVVELVHRLPTVSKWEFDFGTTFWVNKEDKQKMNDKFELRTFGNVLPNVDKTEFTTKFSSYVSAPQMKKLSVDGENTINFALKSGKFMDAKVVFDVFEKSADKFTLQVVSNKEFKPNELIRWDFNVKLADGAKVTNLLSEEYYVSLKDGVMVMKLVVDYPEPKFVSFDVSVSKPKKMATMELGVAGDKLIDAGSSFDTNEKSLSAFFNVYHFASHGHACVKGTAKLIGYSQAMVHVECDHLVTLDLNYDLDTAVSAKLADEKKTELYNFRLALDKANFLDAKYTMDKTALTAFSDRFQQKVEANAAQFKTDFEKKLESTKTNMLARSEQFQKKLPNMGPLREYMKTESSTLYSEIQSDPTLKHICDAVEKFAALAFKVASEFIRIANDFFMKVNAIIKEHGAALMKIFQEKIMPIVSEFVGMLRRYGQQFFEQVVEFLKHRFEEFNQFFGKYQEDFNRIAKQIGGQLRELHAAAIKFTSQLRIELENMINAVLNYVKSTFDLKAMLNRVGDLLREYKVESYVKEMGEELTKAVKENKLLTPETKTFLEALIQYVSTHLTELSVHSTDAEMAEVKKLSGLFVDAVTSTYRFLQQVFMTQKSELSKNKYVSQMSPAAEMSKWQELLKQNFAGLPMFSGLSGSMDGDMPSPLLKFKWSGLNHWTSPETYKMFLHGDWSRLFQLMRVSNWVPPYSFQAQIIDGAHFMTFDGVHYTFAVKSEGGADATAAEPEGCYFVLAADSVHANFTILGTFNNKQSKKLNSILVVDSGNNMFELKANDKAYYNNKARELPLHAAVNVWRDSLGQTTIHHPAGVTVMCERHLEVCTVTVNGFYKNKLRGLLGNANDEQVDDMQLLNGDYVDQHSGAFDSFFQNYQLKKFNAACPKLVSSTGVKLHEHHHGHVGSAECDTVFKTFGYFHAVLPWFKNYKEACEHAAMITEGNKLDTACTIVRGFVRKLNAEYHIPAHVPEACYKDCTNEEAVKDSKVNPKKLDLILLVDFNNTMYTELLPQVVNEFKGQMKTDMNLNVIGYNSNWKYPIHIANPDANPKFNYNAFVNDNLATMPLYSDDHFTTKYPAVNEFLEGFWRSYAQVRENVGASSDAQAFQYAQYYPFRADAFKVIFIMRSEPLRYNVNPVRTTLATALNRFTAARGIHMHLMAPVDDFTLTGSPQNVRNSKLMIGFNEKVVLQNADAKKKFNVGATNLRASVQFKADMGTDMVLRNHDGNNFVFLAQNYQQRNPKDRKVFMQTMVNAVTEQLPRWEITQRCHCGVFDGLYERDVCMVNEEKLNTQSAKAPQRRG